MSTQVPQNIPGLTASADLSAKQYHFVEVSGVRTVASCNATTDVALGVLQNDPISGGAATVAVGGTSKVVAGGAITAGARIAPKADGRAQTAVSTQYARGIALETSTTDGQIIECLLVATTVMA
jgi:hypothetical protein